MAIYIRPFQKSDLKAFKPIEPFTVDELDTSEMAQAIEDSHLAVTGVKNGKIVGCGGVHPINAEQGELWLRLSKDCRTFPVETILWLRSGLKIIEETFPFRQLNAAVLKHYTRGRKLIEYFGFQSVSIIDDKVIMYAKLVRD